MATDVPTPATLARKIGLVLSFSFCPARFEKLTIEDNKILESRPSEKDPRTAAEKLRRSMRTSFVWTSVSLAGGIGVWKVLALIFGQNLTGGVITVLSGTLIILWTTLSLVGWAIQTIGGVTLPERVNGWVFRFSYGVGTALIVSGTLWSL